MADNKKKKLDFASALRALADKIDEEPKAAEEPKSDPKEETLGITINGKFTQLVRGDMTEEAWNKLKDASERQSAFRERKRAKEDAEAAPTKPEELQLQGDRKVAPTEKPLKKLPPKQTGNEPEDQWQNPFPERTEAQPRTVGDLELQSSAGPGMSVRGNMEQMALGATPKVYGNDPASQAAASETLSPPAPNLGASAPEILSGQPLVNDIIVPAAAAVNRVLTPTPAPSAEQLAAREDVAAIEAPPPAAMPPEMAVPTPAEPALAQAQVPATVLPPMSGAGSIAKERKAMQDAAGLHEEALLKQGELESQALKKRVEILKQQQDEEIKLQQRQTLAQTAHAERMQQAQSGLVSLQSRLQDLERQAPDPNRYWNNKDAGQKAMAVIAGALFGATGQGMQWLQRLDALAENDIQQQAAELARKQGLVGKQIDVQNNLVAMARQNGLDDREAISAARAMMKDNFATKFEQYAAESGSEIVKTKALAASAQLRAGAAKDIADLNLKSSAAANDSARTRIAAFDAETRRIDALASAQAKSATGGGKQLTDDAAVKVADMINALKTAKNMSAEFKGKVSGVLNKLGRFDFTGMSDASQYEAKRLVVVQLLGKGLEGGKLTDSDIARYDEMIPRAGDARGAEKWDKLVTELEQKLKSTTDALAATGHNVTGLQQQAGEAAKPVINFTPRK